jgi:hypothetical protein
VDERVSLNYTRQLSVIYSQPFPPKFNSLAITGLIGITTGRVEAVVEECLLAYCGLSLAQAQLSGGSNHLDTVMPPNNTQG